MAGVHRTHKPKRQRTIDKATSNAQSDADSKRTRPTDSRLTTGLALMGILLVGLVLRLSYLREVVVAPDFALPQVDAGYYDYWARAMVIKDWTPPKNLIDFPDPEIPNRPYFHPPGYPFFLAMIYRLTDGSYMAVRLIQMGLGLINCLLAYILGRKLFGRGVGLIFSLFMSSYWVFIYFEGELLSPVLLVGLGLSLLCLLSQWHEHPTWGWALAAGVVFGIYALVRANILLFGPLVVTWAGWRACRHRDLRSFIRTTAGFCIGAILTIAPVTIRNYVVSKDLVLITTNTGINLYVGNNETSTGTYSGLPNLGELGIENEYHPTIIEGVKRFVGRDMKDSEVSSWFVDKAVAYMRDHPWRTLKLITLKATLFWGPEEVPNNKMIGTEKACSHTLRYLPTFPLVLAMALFGLIQLIAGLTERSSQPQTKSVVTTPQPTNLQVEMSVLIVLFVLASFASYLPFFIAGRYRVPIIPALLLFGAYGVHRLWLLGREKHYRTVALYGVLLVGLIVAAHIRLVPHRPQGPYRHLLRATCYRLNDKIDLAIEECCLAIQLAPDNEEGHRRLGDLLMRQNRYTEAIEHYLRAAQLRPGRFDVQYNLGMAFDNQGDLDRAIEHFNLAIRLKPNAADAHYQLGHLLRRQGQAEAAITSYRRAIEYQDDYPQARRDLAAVLLTQKRPQEALDQLRWLVDRTEEQANLYNLMGIAEKSLGHLDAAIEHYRRALAIDPNYYLAYSNLGNALLSQGRTDEAIVQYRRALEIKPDYVNAQRALNATLRSQGSADPSASAERTSR